ncbi:MAG TPA: IS1634 family transposase, partial [bacterium]|nr:IS1634 family transposase [bacterium]
ILSIGERRAYDEVGCTCAAVTGRRTGSATAIGHLWNARGPRQRVVAYLGEVDEHGRMTLPPTAGTRAYQQPLDEAGPAPQWVEVDLTRVRVERTRDFGGLWLGYTLAQRLDLPRFLAEVLPQDGADIPWPAMALVRVLSRLCAPSSELHLAEHLYERSALPDLLGVPAAKVNDDRLYRALDKLLPHKAALEQHLKNRLGQLFALLYDLLLYDVTSTYFEGAAARTPQAQRGSSRDHRPDCTQVLLALVVTREGLPLGYEVFAGNRKDVTTLREVVELMESRYGAADRIWVLDRGLGSEDHVTWLKAHGRRYIVGTPKSLLRRFGRALAAETWQRGREGVEAQLCPAPGGTEVFILCRSAPRREKEQAMHARFERRITEGLAAIATSCAKRTQPPVAIVQRVGRLLGSNSRAAKLFQVEVDTGERGAAIVQWTLSSAWREWARLSEGCYVLRSNLVDWSAEDLWTAYIHLTDAETAFRIQKADLELRPLWHQKEARVQAHILVCFLAYVLWKTLGRWCHATGLGDEPRKILAELSQIRLVDVVLPTRDGLELRKRCVSRPTEHQAILLQRLGLTLPAHLEAVVL